MMEGRRAAALDAARAMVAGDAAGVHRRRNALGIDGFMPVVFHVLVRFGRWEEILDGARRFAANLTVSNAVRHYARGVALTALGPLGRGADGARRRSTDRPPRVPTERPIGNNPAQTVLGIPAQMLEGEIAFREGKKRRGLRGLARGGRDRGRAGLRRAAGLDAAGAPRARRGAARRGRSRRPRQVFREDLGGSPRTAGRSSACARCLRGARRRRRGRRTSRRELERALARADVEIATPCFCQPGVSAK